MQEEFEGIVLKRLPYNDYTSIAYIYTMPYGLLPFMVKKSTLPKNNLTAYLIPLGFVKGDIHYKATNSFHVIRNLTTEHYLFSIREDFDKLSIAQFFSDFLYAILKYPHSDLKLYAFIKEFVFLLESSSLQQVANIHLFGLIKLMKYVGIEPDDNYSATHIYFDVKKAHFVPFMEGKSQLSLELSNLWHFFLSSNVQNFHSIRIHHELRTLFIQSVIQFYSQHLDIPLSLSSLNVLNTMYEQKRD
jgi:DNA repair protein RecO